MKKTIITILISLFSYSMASAEVGVNIGVSGNLGVFAAKAHETVDERQTTGDEVAAVGYTSIFIEKTLGQYLTLGVDYLPSALSTDTKEDNKCDLTTAGTGNSAAGVCTATVNSVKVDFSDMTTIYAALNLNENFYIKAGMISVDVDTKESLATGSAYGNKSLDGTMFGAGYNKTLDSGVFFRAEANMMEFDGATFTSTETTGVVSANTIKLTQLNGATGKISIGKSF